MVEGLEDSDTILRVVEIWSICSVPNSKCKPRTKLKRSLRAKKWENVLGNQY